MINRDDDDDDDDDDNNNNNNNNNCMYNREMTPLTFTEHGVAIVMAEVCTF